VKSRGSQCNETLSEQLYDRAKSSVRKPCSDGDARTDSGRLFQTDAAAAGKVRSPMVARAVRGATSTDVVEERSRWL